MNPFTVVLFLCDCVRSFKIIITIIIVIIIYTIITPHLIVTFNKKNSINFCLSVIKWQITTNGNNKIITTRPKLESARARESGWRGENTSTSIYIIYIYSFTCVWFASIVWSFTLLFHFIVIYQFDLIAI